LKKLTNNVLYNFLGIFFTILPLFQTNYMLNWLSEHPNERTTIGIILMVTYVFLGLIIVKMILLFRHRFYLATSFSQQKEIIKEKYVFYISFFYMAAVIFIMQAFFGTQENQVISYFLLILSIIMAIKAMKKYSKKEKLEMLNELPFLVKYQFKLLLYLGETIDKFVGIFKKSNKNEETE